MKAEREVHLDSVSLPLFDDDSRNCQDLNQLKMCIKLSGINTILLSSADVLLGWVGSIGSLSEGTVERNVFVL